MRVWITGSGGLIGNYLLQTAPNSAHPSAGNTAGSEPIITSGLPRAQLDLADFAAVRREYKSKNPDAVIHCAALSRSPECQAKPERARLLNVEVTRLLAELAAEKPFVFFSTDLVFDGKQGLYTEGDKVNPLSVYAETKAAAEALVLRNPRHTVIRTSLNGGTSPTGDRGFNEQMRQAWRGGQTLRLFTDEFRSPIAAEVTARATWDLLLRGQSGMFHVAGTQRLSRYQIGELLAGRRQEVAGRFEAASLKDYQGAPRSPDTSLNCSKAQSVLSFRLPRFAEWLEEHPDEPF